MVPFAEVILLTAMEYNRGDKKKGRKTKKKGKETSKTTTITVATSMDVHHISEDEPEEKGCRRCWIPQLETLGNILVGLLLIGCNIKLL